jgi:hypothetical protein
MVSGKMRAAARARGYGSKEVTSRGSNGDSSSRSYPAFDFTGPSHNEAAILSATNRTVESVDAANRRSDLSIAGQYPGEDVPVGERNEYLADWYMQKALQQGPKPPVPPSPNKTAEGLFQTYIRDKAQFWAALGEEGATWMKKFLDEAQAAIEKYLFTMGRQGLGDQVVTGSRHSGPQAHPTKEDAIDAAIMVGLELLFPYLPGSGVGGKALVSGGPKGMKPARIFEMMTSGEGYKDFEFAFKRTPQFDAFIADLTKIGKRGSKAVKESKVADDVVTTGKSLMDKITQWARLGFWTGMLGGAGVVVHDILSPAADLMPDVDLPSIPGPQVTVDYPWVTTTGHPSLEPIVVPGKLPLAIDSAVKVSPYVGQFVEEAGMMYPLIGKPGTWTHPDPIIPEPTPDKGKPPPHVGVDVEVEPRVPGVEGGGGSGGPLQPPDVPDYCIALIKDAMQADDPGALLNAPPECKPLILWAERQSKMESKKEAVSGWSGQQQLRKGVSSRSGKARSNGRSQEAGRHTLKE